MLARSRGGHTQKVGYTSNMDISKKSAQGFLEIEHTADWELEVWAEDLPGLLEEAARGMYALAGVKWDETHSREVSFFLSAEDPESLLVGFLAELLYYLEQEGLAFYRFILQANQYNLNVLAVGAPVTQLQKEIKAVTYHNLKIEQNAAGLKTRIVFDV